MPHHHKDQLFSEGKVDPPGATLEDQTSSGLVEEPIRSEISCSTLTHRSRLPVSALFKSKSANHSLLLSPFLFRRSRASPGFGFVEPVSSDGDVCPRLHPCASRNVVFTDEEEEENEFHGQFFHHETRFQGEADCFPELTQT